MSTSPLAVAIDRFYRAYEEFHGPIQRDTVEPPFRPDFRAALRVEQIRMARLRLAMAKREARQAAGTVWAYSQRVKSLTTDGTPCTDCHQPIGEHRRFTGHGGVLCYECECLNCGH